jgi:hypothetical protein
MPRPYGGAPALGGTPRDPDEVNSGKVTVYGNAPALKEPIDKGEKSQGAASASGEIYPKPYGMGEGFRSSGKAKKVRGSGSPEGAAGTGTIP